MHSENLRINVEYFCSQAGDIHEQAQPLPQAWCTDSVGAAFKFYSGQEEKRAPAWMRRMHLEFLYRIFAEPKKQLKRCWMIAKTLPKAYSEEKKRKRTAKEQWEYNELKIKS